MTSILNAVSVHPPALSDISDLYGGGRLQDLNCSLQLLLFEIIDLNPPFNICTNVTVWSAQEGDIQPAILSARMRCFTTF